MAEVLKEWLTERLQRPIKWTPEEFGNMMKDGYIISNVLLSYNIINEEKFFLIRSSINSEEIKNNWIHLREWLKELQVHLSDPDLQSIMEGKASMLLRLFYILFLHLDKKDRTDFIKRERKMMSSLVDKLGNRFTVERVHEEDESFVDDLSKPLLDEKQFIEWQRKKSEKVKDTYDYIRHKYSKMIDKIEESKIKMKYISPTLKITSKEKTEMDIFSKKHPCEFKGYTYEELLELDQKALERKRSIVDTQWAKNYMDNLFTKIHKRSESEEFHKQVRNDLTNSLWDLSMAEEEEKLDTELAKKVMKLSQFEKQMCTQLMETKQQARNLFQNRAHAELQFAEQRDQQFNQYLDTVKEQIHLEIVEIDFEKQRQNMLHRKLYAEKMKRKRQHYYEICYETVLSIIDYATKYAYFKKLLEDDIPDHFIHEWKNLYYKQQPIFDIYLPTEDLLKEQNLEEEVVPEEEEIVRLELDRQNALNETEFMEYHNYAYPWTLDLLIPNFDPESEERKYEYLGTRVLGHVVYTLLEIKYPYPPAKLPADLPDFPVKALLRDLPDKSMVSAMQTLLDFKKVHVTRLEAAIYYCLKRFKTELVGCTDIELSFDKFGVLAQTEEDKELIRKIKAEDDMANKASELIVGPVIASPPNTKQTQTPKTLPEEEIVLSTAAELGRYTYEALGSGEPLTDHLIAAMLVEYLKEIQNIDGFVIVNYPNSYREAQILEETFSGREPPDESKVDDRDDIYLEESIKRHRKKEKDQYKEIRVSKLVNDPHIKKSDKPFESYFTCYIKLKLTEDILQELVIWDLTEENSELIDRFYAVLGLNYSMYYEIIDKEFLAQICKYIIGDYTMPLKSCDKLFGENVLSELEFPSTDDKRTKTKIVKPEVNDLKSKDKLRRGSKSKSSMDNQTDLYKLPSSPDAATDTDTVVLMEELTGEENESQSYVSLEEIKLLAGEEDWEYGNIPISEIIGVALATCWEEIEKSYVHDMQQLFLAKRLQMNCLIPYARFIKDKMEQIITLPSFKQDLVSAFQKEYNDFENDWRDINLAKNEWHCRVKELQHKLYTICDERKLRAQQQRQALICENWAMEELTTMVNTFISCMQAELNRSILTFQTLHDFYYAMIKRMPPNDRLSSKDLTKIQREVEDATGAKKGTEDKVFKQLKNAFQELQLKNIEIDYSNNPFNLVIENNVKFALKVIKDINDSYRSLISREYSEIAKIVPVPKRKDDNTSEESVNAEEVFKQNALKCIEEWTVGINGEMFRASLRMLALQYKCYHDMKLFSDHIYKTFMDVQASIDTYYLNEIKSVDRLCKYLQMAVENGRRIQETLILEHDTFVIDPNLLQFPPPEPPPEKPESLEIVHDFEFKIGQLARLRSQFQIVAPSGKIMQKHFIYLLQDFFIFGKESCEGSAFPEAWKRIDPEQIPKFVYNLYGETVYVDWRDFLIYCLNIRFPTIEELLELRKRFRCEDLESTEVISRDDYLKEELWFEQYFDPEDKQAMLRKHLIKQFLFELFETSFDMINYPAFLLAFCKSHDTFEGFANALAMAVGKKICFSLQECEEVITELIKLKKYKDACLACALKCTNQFLEKVLTNVINTCEGTSIIELPYEPVAELDKKGKKSKAGMSKTKSTLSARVPKTQKSMANQSKTAQSATNVNTTYICRPCEAEAEVIEEKPPEKEELEEEHKNEPQEDPNLVYAVSQEVIWNVLRACLPWHFELFPEAKMTPYVEYVTDAMKRLQADTDNGDIYISKFTNDPNVCKMLHKVKKFTILDIAEEARNIFFR
ncbi:sperm flagellar protein 2-like [Plodia interpunctella]|uniref:sperm flagellar protein 2-like n=1 Tax=Plodia interpunctella TaxID=58824 RepID=UPI0023687A67|nr:sperm flagellar protein 2-like [Plodia interpunctella]